MSVNTHVTHIGACAWARREGRGGGSERGCRYITTGLHCKTKENKSHFDHMKAIVFKEESHVDVCVERVCTHDIAVV